MNGLDPSFKRIELIHMLGMAKPELVFCDFDIFELVRDSLNELKNDAKIFTYGGCTDGCESVDVLFNETETGEFFMFVWLCELPFDLFNCLIQF